jgi:hypothetical protein
MNIFPKVNCYKEKARLLSSDDSKQVTRLQEKRNIIACYGRVASSLFVDVSENEIEL